MIIRVCSGKVSIECPGMNHEVLSLYLSNSLSKRGTPTSPAKSPREISSGESSPPYEPSHPPTASTSIPYASLIFLVAIALPPEKNPKYGNEVERSRKASHHACHYRFFSPASRANCSISVSISSKP